MLQQVSEDRRERLKRLWDRREDAQPVEDHGQDQLPAVPQNPLAPPGASDLTEDEVGAEGAQRASPGEREDPARLRAVQDDGPGLRGDRHGR